MALGSPAETRLRPPIHVRYMIACSRTGLLAARDEPQSCEIAARIKGLLP